jgi:hypothetical protein
MQGYLLSFLTAFPLGGWRISRISLFCEINTGNLAIFTAIRRAYAGCTQGPASIKSCSDIAHDLAAQIPIGAQGHVIVRFEFKAKYSNEQLRRRHIALKK